ncbi:MAG: CopG family transcriptional regulator [Candidatus Dactylopiibacterium carminicum]|uniref:CopG family transcriptional regulator n=1 Tax=Candidatus Dactylopiibacterium carminicum TaxID=857335 RepID=A0A272EMD9_9RHOO|nr:CopG family transcriptional regulator [Candidatus Dactylopiibacterium carminicum]KAF7597662.1 CopG family transcriptional regulator [Candidatus Dactylopiibacterium carminicum]PAS91284.1 MAG: CopG family transcriptional regulator [Candidatus Dactylopiibacterium carminicum]PAS91819.1 MAG: CopG family transcriptional regulator [Candidatus Dactylopiibacterium carminicum]PAS93472.1 MAG: hypothetical protein BSR46_17635 [Candidatus Dactylopiibacterium carminicum]
MPNTVSISDKLAERLEAAAGSFNRTPDSVVSEALQAWLDREDRRMRETIEAIEDAAAGNVVSHEAVSAWIDSWDTDHELPCPGSPQQ